MINMLSQFASIFLTFPFTGRLPALPSASKRWQEPFASLHASNETIPIDFPHFVLRGTARPSFTARIEGAHSDRAASASKKDGLAVPLPLLLRRFLALSGPLLS